MEPTPEGWMHGINSTISRIKPNVKPRKRHTKMRKHKDGAEHVNAETMPERVAVSCKLYLGEDGVGPACECDREK